eukprot:CAMPEP_0198295330 /NCGR_PEP_ID=MMETSP1449-20131203/27213_1 /TAXON_ID=420275 /ORGANISM="Attheya septentrionalis, Strain CCMP2084" /LENGTH=430 /DNA_ID=CAMNT_0043995609 /DNA_START=113 /DNA_END=1405 /DNA_ORIENTATION=+
MSSYPEWDRILSASQRNDAARIHRLVDEEGVSPNHANVVGQSALHVAAFWGNVEAMEALLSYSDVIEVNATNRITVATPLHCTVQSSKEPASRRAMCAQLLLEAGADPTCLDQYGSSPLHYCQDDDTSETNNADEMRTILSSKLERPAWIQLIDNDVLSSSSNGNNETIDWFESNLLEKNEDDVSVIQERDATTKCTPLLYAFDRFLGLIEKDSIEEEQKEGMKVLLSICQWLLEKGHANPNDVPQNIGSESSQSPDRHLPTENTVSHEQKTQSEDGSENIMDPSDMPLHRVCVALQTICLQRMKQNDGKEVEEPLKQMAYLLKSHGAVVSGETEQLLHNAARRNVIAFVKFAVERLEMNPNAQGRQGMTPLHFAARSGQTSVAQYLLSLPQIDVSIQDDRGKTALDAAQSNDKLDIVALILGLSQQNKE